MYYIYHIPTVKIGCTEQPPQDRVKAQGYTNYEVLEEHTDVYIASHREIALQKQYGLPVDKVLYYVTLKLKYDARRLQEIKNSELHKKNAKALGRYNTENNTPDVNFKNRSKGGKKAGNDNVKLARGCMNFENRSKGGAKGGKVNSEKCTGLFGMDKESIYKSTSKGGKIAGAIQRQCPYCGKIIKGNVYFTWHGDKCKAKPQ
jgi:hypothetical protein